MKYIYTVLFLIAIAFTPTGHVQAQKRSHQGPPTKEMIQEFRDFKIKYLMQEMELPADKQAEFTKIYTKYETEKGTLFKETRMLGAQAAKAKTDADYLAAAEKMASAKHREGEIEESCFIQLKKILTPLQLFKFKIAENKFDRKVMEQHRKSNKH